MGKARISLFIQCGDQPSSKRILPHPFSVALSSYGHIFELALVTDDFGYKRDWGLGGDKGDWVVS